MLLLPNTRNACFVENQLTSVIYLVFFGLCSSLHPTAEFISDVLKGLRHSTRVCAVLWLNAVLLPVAISLGLQNKNHRHSSSLQFLQAGGQKCAKRVREETRTWLLVGQSGQSGPKQVHNACHCQKGNPKGLLAGNTATPFHFRRSFVAFGAAGSFPCGG